MEKATHIKTLKPGTKNVRAVVVDRAAINPEARTVELAFSSETPYERWWGVEILDHSPQSIRLGRLTSGGPLLTDHENSIENQVGVIESVEIGADRVGRAIVRFGRDASSDEVFQKVADGIVRNVSVGYVIHKAQLIETGDEGPDTYRVTDWEPLEISLVPVPADASVGVGRSHGEESPVLEEVAEQTELKNPVQEKSMPEINVQEIESAARAAGEKAAQARVNDIIAMGEHYKATDLAREFIASGKSVEEFRVALLERMATSGATRSEGVVMSDKEAKQYSYVRALAAALARAEGRDVSGFEVEVSQDLERSLPANAKRNGGIFVPMQLQRSAISTALYNTSGKGASTVFTEAGEFIDLLRNASITVGLGARVLSGLTGPVSFPSQTGGVSVSWVAENSGTDVGASNATLSSVGLSPKTLQGTTAFSRQLMAQSSLDVEAFIRADLAAAHALAWDLAVLHGTGSNNQPTGIYAASNVNAVAMGGVPTFGKLIDMITEVMKDNALAGSLAFATTPGLAGKLAQTVIAASTDTRMIWDGKLDSGTLAGYAAVASNQVSAALGAGSEHGLIFGNWSDVLIGNWGGGLELVVDPYSLKKQGMIEVTSFQLCDIALRHPESFCKATGATIA